MEIFKQACWSLTHNCDCSSVLSTLLPTASWSPEDINSHGVYNCCHIATSCYLNSASLCSPEIIYISNNKIPEISRCFRNIIKYLKHVSFIYFFLPRILIWKPSILTFKPFLKAVENVDCFLKAHFFEN